MLSQEFLGFIMDNLTMNTTVSVVVVKSATEVVEYQNFHLEKDETTDTVRLVVCCP